VVLAPVMRLAAECHYVMPQSTLVIVLLIQFAVVVAVTVIVLALRRWQRAIWMREQGQTPKGFEVEVEVEVRGKEKA
jgi:hypothetical protein